MTQSPEYPDLAWMPPRAWTDANRSSVQLIVIHTTEGSARGTSAEDGASYDQRRTDGTSTHYFHDNDSTVQCVRTADQAHAARAQGNRRGIQHELCTVAGTAIWTNAYHRAMLARAAKQAARDAHKWGIPVRHLTVAQVAAGEPGFCGHWDVTRAFPQDKGTHTDPGANFPWTAFLNLVRAELVTPAKPSEDIVSGVDTADAKIIIKQMRDTPKVLSDTEHLQINAEVSKAVAALLTPALNALLAAAKSEAAEVPPTVEQISAGVLAALSSMPTAEDKANLLAQLLGSDAAAVGRILAGITQ